MALPVHHPHSYLSSSSMPLSKSSRSADILRLLDPAYAGSYNPSSGAVYIDSDGDLHDPDYRDFPPVPTKSRSRSSTRCNELSRPQWGFFEAYSYDDMAVEDEDFDAFDRPHPARPKPRARSGSDSASAPSPCWSPMTYSPSGMSSSGRSDSILSSLESPFSEEETHRPTSRNSRRTVKVMRSPASRTIALDEEQEDEAYFSSAPVHPVSFFSTPPPRPSLDLERWDSTFGTSSPPGDESATCEDEPEATTPTCADALRHEWEALSLRVKFSLFRFRRRLAGHG